MPNIWCYAIMRDEAVLAPYFMRHYGKFCERVIIYDDQSSDGTPELVKKAGAEVRQYDNRGRKTIHGQTHLANTAWQEAKGQAEWIIWVDADEFLVGDDVPGYLEECQGWGITLPRVQGYSMIADSLPTKRGQIYNELKLGVPDDLYSKQAVFSPILLQIRYSHGRHNCDPRGHIRRDTEPRLKLLHYRYFGPEWFRERNAKNSAYLFQQDHPQAERKDEKYSVGWFEAQKAQAVDVRQPVFLAV